MKYWYQRPNKSIAEYVRTVLVLEGFSPSESSDLPLVTNGIPALLCCMEKDSGGEGQIARLSLFGKSISSEYWDIDADKTMIVYFFKPFAMASMFNIPVAKLSNKPIDLQNCIPHKINALKTQLIYAESTSEKVQVLEHFLTHQLDENKKVCEIVRRATDEIMCNPSTEILSALLQKLHLNKRTFQRIFKKYVGITPNHYRRICQFHVAFTQVRTRDFKTLTDVAYDNGFADQSHFTRSFREFADTTPNHYLQSGLQEKP
jgi:AraC-like DNA-binding protein